MKKYWHELSTLRAGLGQVEYVEIFPDAVPSFLIGNCRPVFVVGRGSNLVGRDDDWPGIIVKLVGTPPEIQDSGRVKVSSGYSLLALADWCARESLGGLAPLCGIPGSIGGALKMNAGANGIEIGEFAEAIDGIVLGDGSSWHWQAGDGGWGYRKSPVPEGVLVTSAVLSLRPGDAEAEIEAVKNECRRRAKVTPRGCSVGSIFRNPEGCEHAAGWYLEMAGCKALKRGNLQVSEQHANWIVNLSGQPASAADFHALRDEMRQAVLTQFGIDLVSEVATL